MSNDYPYEYQICTDMDQGQARNQNLDGFNPLFWFTEVVGLMLIIVVAAWNLQYRNGFAWTSNPSLQFNWHPLLMTIGLVFLYANGMLIYRSQRTMHKRKLKLIHAGIMLFIILLTIFALVAVFDFHNLSDPPIPNMYSLHSWVGMTSILLFCCQWVGGLVSFLYPTLEPSLRAAYLPIHVYFGTAGFVTTIAACLIGLTEKAIFTKQYPSKNEKVNDYTPLYSEGAVVNVIGMGFILFGGLTLYLISRERYKRLPQPEDDVLLRNRN